MNISKREAEKYLTCFLDSIMDTLEKDGRVVVQGFGSFKMREYAARMSKKPITGEMIYLPVRRKPVFHAGKELKERINKDYQPAMRKQSPLRIERITAHFENVHGTAESVSMAK
ncbi:MAG: HU family DNA-binding protein, partial [Nitrospinaceae bacterium]